MDEQGYTIYDHVSTNGLEDIYQLLLIKRKARELMEDLMKPPLNLYDDMLAHTVQAILPLAHTKEWHKHIFERQHMIMCFIGTVFPKPDSQAMLDPRMHNLLEYAKKFEGEAYELADSMSDYCQKIAEEIVKGRIKLEKKQAERRRRDQNLQV